MAALLAWLLPSLFQYCTTQPKPNSTAVPATITSAGIHDEQIGSRVYDAFADYAYSINGATYKGRMQSLSFIFPVADFGALSNTQAVAFVSTTNPAESSIPTLGEQFTKTIFWNYILFFISGGICAVIRGLTKMSGAHYDSRKPMRPF